MTAMPALSSPMPRPQARAPSERNGWRAPMPRRYTVSMCAMSKMRLLPLPVKRARTMRPMRSGVSAMRGASAGGSINSTVPPKAFKRSKMSCEMRSKPSRSPLPDSIATRSFSVSSKGACWAWASSHTAALACARTGLGAVDSKASTMSGRETRKALSRARHGLLWRCGRNKLCGAMASARVEMALIVERQTWAFHSCLP